MQRISTRAVVVEHVVASALPKVEERGTYGVRKVTLRVRRAASKLKQRQAVVQRRPLADRHSAPNRLHPYARGKHDEGAVAVLVTGPRTPRKMAEFRATPSKECAAQLLPEKL